MLGQQRIPTFAAVLAVGVPDQRKLIRNAQLDLEINNFDSSLQEITKIVINQVEQINETFPDAQKIQVNENTVLFGKGSSIDSLSLVSIIVDLESLFSEEKGFDISLKLRALFLDPGDKRRGRLGCRSSATARRGAPTGEPIRGACGVVAG